MDCSSIKLEPPARQRAGWIPKRLQSGLAYIAPNLALLLIWEAVVRFGLLDLKVLPAPHTIVVRGLELMGASNNHVLVSHMAHSLLRALVAFVLAALVAVPFGFVLGLSRSAHAWFSPVLSLLLPLPAVAWTPIFLVTMGRGDATIISVCFLGAFFPIAYSTIQGVQAIPQHALWVVRSMGASRLHVFFRVLLPSSLPTLITGFKLGLAHSWRTLVAAEMLAAASFGLGYMIFAARAYADVPSMFVGIALLAILGFSIEHLLFGAVERATIRRWYPQRGRRTR
ncbi:MAG: ABC transporter permease [Burkholderiales bacterium]|nr:ABC transporter permease [Burkholderiales bacterium]